MCGPVIHIPTLLTQLQLASLSAGLHCLKNGSIVSQLQRGSWRLPHSHANHLLHLLFLRPAALWLEQARPQNLLISTKALGAAPPITGVTPWNILQHKDFSSYAYWRQCLRIRENILKSWSNYRTLNKAYFIIQSLWREDISHGQIRVTVSGGTVLFLQWQAGWLGLEVLHMCLLWAWEAGRTWPALGGRAAKPDQSKPAWP